jgi:hypothetical protein
MVAVLTCNRCGSEWIDPKTAEALDAAVLTLGVS